MSSASDSGMVKMMGIVAGALIGLALMAMITANLLGDKDTDMSDPVLVKAQNDRIRPVGAVRTSAEELGLQVAAAADSGPVSAEEIVNSACNACHQSGVSGAPKTGDEAAWTERRKAGLDSLVSSVINGKNAMPPRAGTDYSDEELRAAVQYLAMFEEVDDLGAAAEEATETEAAPAEDAAAEDETASNDSAPVEESVAEAVSVVEAEVANDEPVALDGDVAGAEAATDDTDAGEMSDDAAAADSDGASGNELANSVSAHAAAAQEAFDEAVKAHEAAVNTTELMESTQAEGKAATLMSNAASAQGEAAKSALNDAANAYDAAVEGVKELTGQDEAPATDAAASEPAASDAADGEASAESDPAIKTSAGEVVSVEHDPAEETDAEGVTASDSTMDDSVEGGKTEVVSPPVADVTVDESSADTEAAQSADEATTDDAAAAGGNTVATLASSEVPESISQVVNTVCAACHIAGVANAPKFGDTAAWNERLSKGLDESVQVVISGKGAMPPRGGSALDDQQLSEAIRYMLSK